MTLLISYICGLAFCLSTSGLVISMGLLTHPVLRRESRISAVLCLLFTVACLGEYYFAGGSAKTQQIASPAVPIQLDHPGAKTVAQQPRHAG